MKSEKEKKEDGRRGGSVKKKENVTVKKQIQIKATKKSNKDLIKISFNCYGYVGRLDIMLPEKN